MPTLNPKQAARNRAGSRVRFARYFSQVCKQSAKATGTVYHGSDENGPDYDTKTKNLDTVCEGETLTNFRGAHKFDERTVENAREFINDVAKGKQRFASGG